MSHANGINCYIYNYQYTLPYYKSWPLLCIGKFSWLWFQIADLTYIGIYDGELGMLLNCMMRTIDSWLS